MKQSSRASSTPKKQIAPTSMVESPLQSILSSIQSKGTNTQSFRDQISQFLTHLNEDEKVFMLPSMNKSEYLQIFNIRNNEAVMRHRIGRKRQAARRNQSKGKDKQKDKDTKIMFVVEESLCTNCILLAMANRNNEKAQFNLGCRLEDWKRNEELLTNQQKIEETLKDIVIYENIQSILKRKLESDMGREYRKKNGKSNNSKNSIFGHLKHIKIQINNEQLTLQQWASALNVGGQILKLIQRQSMNQLQTFQFVIKDDRKYTQHIKDSSQLQDKVNQICNSIRRIIEAKNSNDEDFGYFPNLAKVAFNPILYIMAQENSCPLLENLGSQKVSTEEQTQHSESCVHVTKLNLIDITEQINNAEYLDKFLKVIFSNFPKLTDLSLQMSPNVCFDLFNRLAGELYKYCCLLQSLHILHNNEQIDKLPGLRSILQNYPYLSDLKIKITGRGDENMNRQFEKQWLFIKQIQFRRLHIQRLINMIKILQKKGYNKSQCMEIIQFMKPLKFPTITG